MDTEAAANSYAQKPAPVMLCMIRAGLLSHGDPAEGVCDGADEDDCGEERAEEADHGVEDPAADDRVIRHDQDRNSCVDPPAADRTKPSFPENVLLVCAF